MRLLLIICLLVAPLAAADLASLQRELSIKQAKLQPDDIEGRTKLAAWCFKKKLRQSGLRLQRQIIKLDPTNTKARKALGHVKDGDNWFESEDAKQAAAGFSKLLSTFEKLEDKDGYSLINGHYLTSEQVEELDAGKVLKAHKQRDGQVALTREFRVVSALKWKDTKDLAKVLESAFAIWRDETNNPWDAAKRSTFHILIKKNHKAYVKMIKDDIETYSAEQAKSHGFFDGRKCILSYFHDWYRTRRIILHEARHQFDSLVAKTGWGVPAWYHEGIAEYWSMHNWDGKKLELGQLVPKKNYSLLFCGKLLDKKKILGAQATLSQGWPTSIDPAFYQNSWAFIYYCKHSGYADGFKKFETKLAKSEYKTQAQQIAGFKELVTDDFTAFDKAYKKQL
ncbi:MAG: hypothetical protein L3J82_08830, partial [Planctomycetes bacterium]|nr:hypothetical protein [Planctomycetota bacterium]